MVSGGDLDPALLDRAVDYFEKKDRGEGPAAQLAGFVEPLLEAAGGDPAGVERALTFGMVCWNLALCEGDQRETMLADLARTLAKTEEDAAEFRSLALNMVERHRMMFPGLHRK
jgi:hypothetical protein